MVHLKYNPVSAQIDLWTVPPPVPGVTLIAIACVFISALLNFKWRDGKKKEKKKKKNGGLHAADAKNTFRFVDGSHKCRNLATGESLREREEGLPLHKKENKKKNPLSHSF